ncbi:unnamed protein product [Rodentolepis nana]|uniref:Uncharacterized protein n=1 Tax=Rodentolepis nana TaxID=102285 RepID=A0A0R3TFB1_RODNA|nr:unnamed protein product [Rodentolepis nana]
MLNSKHQGTSVNKCSVRDEVEKCWYAEASLKMRENAMILEPCFSRTLPGWKPRRLGGGLGGFKESGQLRFGGIARPFRRPLRNTSP